MHDKFSLRKHIKIELFGKDSIFMCTPVSVIYFTMLPEYGNRDLHL